MGSDVLRALVCAYGIRLTRQVRASNAIGNNFISKTKIMYKKKWPMVGIELVTFLFIACSSKSYHLKNIQLKKQSVKNLSGTINFSNLDQH